MILSIEEKFGKDIQKVFEDERFKDIDVIKRGFVSSNIIPLESVLFIGINPSYLENKSTNSDNFYSLAQKDNEYKQYFSKFEEIKNYTNLPLAHIDLLFIRETEQKNIDRILKTKIGVEFIWEQLQVSKQILEMAKPKVVVVSNTKARLFFGKDRIEKDNLNVWMGYDFKFDETIGTHRIVNKESTLKGIPVFFTSMLSGQRALDNGSYERLKWHINFALKGGAV